MSKNDQISRIKSMPITDFLSSLGVEPASRIGQQYFYHSPFREENTPSFCVHPNKNVWYDHGDPDRKGGDIIDLAMQVLKIDMPTAIQMLDQVSLNPKVNSALQQEKAQAPVKKKAASKTTLQIIRVEEFQSTILNGYLRSRGIKTELLTQSIQTMTHLKQVIYKVEGRDKEYFALGWKNSAGDFELRSKKFQSFIGKTKTYTYLKGRIPGIAIFESFIDYFSALTHFGKPSLGYDILILNSTRLVKQTLELVLAQPEIHWFGDNDSAGLKALAYYKKECQGIKITNQAYLYQGFKDFNDKLTNTAPAKPLPKSNDSFSEVSQNAKWWLWVVFNDVEDGANKTRTFYGYNTSETGLEYLLNLREHTLQNVKLSRLCERTTGRDFKVLEEAWH